MSDGLDRLSPEEQRELLAELLRKKSSAPKTYPLALAQQRLWFFDRLQPGNPVYNIPIVTRLEGHLDVPLLERALTEVARRHDVFRTTFAQQGRDPVQIVAAAENGLPLTVVDLADLAEEEREREALRVANEEARRSFDLEQGPLTRVRLLRLAPDTHLFVFVQHHIISEAWSIALIFRELTQIYGALARGERPQLPAPPHQYGDCARWQRDWVREDVVARELDYWKRTLAGELTALQLPIDHPRPPVQSLRGAWIADGMPSPLLRALESLSRGEGVTLYMTLLAAYQTLLWRYTGQDDVLVGAPVAGRDRPEAEKVIGFFVNTLVLRSYLGGDPTFRELLARVREVCLDAYSNQTLPFERLVEELRPERSLSQSPLFQAMFVLQNTPRPSLELPGLTASRRLPLTEVHNGGAKVDLSLIVEEREGEAYSALEYSTDLFEEATARRMLGHWRTLLEGIVENPDRPIGELPILTPSERRRSLVDWNDAKTDYPRTATIHALVEEHARRAPDAIAVSLDGRVVTYRELNERANRLAHRLQALGVGHETLVGLYLERSPYTIVAMLGILKAGGAYLPLATEYPPERLAFMLEDARAPVVITQASMLERLPAHAGHTLCIDRDWPEIASCPATDPESAAGPDSLALVIFTSGSTGLPKGVELLHRGVTRLVRNANYVEFSPADRMAQASTVSFDAATFEIWGALLNGATLVIVPRSVTLAPQAFASLLAEEKVSKLFVTTALFNQIARYAPAAFGGLDDLFFGGEAADPSAVRTVLQHGRPRRIVNLYGPAENTTLATWYEIDDVPEGATTVPIGRPVSNTTIYVLDRHRQPVPVGVGGELYVGGDGLARGYMNRRELTAERFVLHPFSDDPDERLYGTGDVVRYRPDGNIEFLGRVDDQVKMRGFRIEPGEIEATLSQHPDVDEAVVMLRRDGPGDARLVAYVVPDRPGAVSDRLLRDLLSEKLPEYMVPSAFVLMDELPINENGKVDRAALPAPEVEDLGKREEFVAPRDPIERELTEIWQDVLGKAPIGVRDDFFDLGGHSLIAVQLFSRIEEAFGANLPLDTLFQRPTIEGLVEVIRRGEALSTSMLVKIQPLGSRRPLFCVPPAASPGLVYAPLARSLGKDQPVFGLSPRGLEGAESPANWYRQTAAHFLEEIRSVQPCGPYAVAGSCFGGMLAFELAQQILEQGDEVGALILIDAGHPLRRDARLLVRRLLWAAWARTVNALRPGEPWEHVVIPRHRVRWDVLSPPSRDSATVHQQVWDANLRAAAHYVTQPYPGRVTLIQSRQLDAQRDIRTEWEKIAAGGVDYHAMGSDHFDMLHDPHVREVAQTIRACLDAVREPGRVLLSA